MTKNFFISVAGRQYGKRSGNKGKVRSLKDPNNKGEPAAETDTGSRGKDCRWDAVFKESDQVEWCQDKAGPFRSHPCPRVLGMRDYSYQVNEFDSEGCRMRMKRMRR